MIAVLTPLLSSMGPLALVLLLAILFVETGLLVGSFLPGDSLLFTAGVLVAAHALPLPMWVLVPACAAAAVVGDQVGYQLGRRFGPRIFKASEADGGRRARSRHHLEQAHDFFVRHGGRAVLLARFVPVVRGFTPAAAGAAGMPYQRFTAYNVAGGIGWTALLLTAGYYAGGIPLVAHHVELLAIMVASLGVLPVLGAWLRRRGSTPPADTPAPRHDRNVLLESR